MTENDRVFDAFRNCISEPKCKECPWEECNALNNRRVDIPIDLALAVMRRLKAQEPKMVAGVAEIYKDILVGNCPSCGQTIVSNVNKPTKYCRFCGQGVKWE